MYVGWAMGGISARVPAHLTLYTTFHIPPHLLPAQDHAWHYWHSLHHLGRRFHASLDRSQDYMGIRVKHTLWLTAQRGAKWAVPDPICSLAVDHDIAADAIGRVTSLF